VLVRAASVGDQRPRFLRPALDRDEIREDGVERRLEEAVARRLVEQRPAAALGRCCRHRA